MNEELPPHACSDGSIEIPKACKEALDQTLSLTEAMRIAMRKTKGHYAPDRVWGELNRQHATRIGMLS